MRILFICIVIGLAAAILWLSRENAPNEAADAADTTLIERSEPDLRGEGVSFRQFRADGSLQYRLDAASINQFSDQSLTRMIEPDLLLLSTTQAPWRIRSAHGYLRQRPGPDGVNEDVVFLREDVVLTQDHTINGPITIRSDSFYIYPDREYAETEQDVMIDTEVGRTKAVGMRADMKSGLLILSSSERQRVHTIVLPSQFKSRQPS